MELGRIDPERLVFVDKRGTHTSLAPIYAYAPIGERAFFETPRNRAKNTTLLTSLHGAGMGLLWRWRGLRPPESSRLRDLRRAGASLRPEPGAAHGDGQPTANFSVIDLYRMMRTKGFDEGLTQGLLDRSCMDRVRGSIPTQPAVGAAWGNSEKPSADPRRGGEGRTA
jgi:hypothetical protein